MPTRQGFRYRSELESGRGGRRRMRRTHGRSLLVTGLVILLLVPAGILAIRSLAVSLSNGGDKEMSTGRTTDPKTSSPALDQKDPFAGTPAATYPIGQRGIVLPAAKAVDSWTAAQVQDVLMKTKDTLVAARLDPTMVERGQTTKYLNMISPGARQGVKDKLDGGEALNYVTRLAAGYTLATEMRVKGQMSYTVGKDKQLIVAADYIWVYPLNGQLADDAKGAGARLALVRTVETYHWYAPSSVTNEKEAGLRPGEGQIFLVNMDCQFSKQGLLALQRQPTDGTASTPDIKAYDPKTRPEDVPNAC